ncbi:MAG: glycosyltransferase [Trueperaceae bacterium]|nr:glycosyltransferase [Trueperaceae bacterium]
MRIAEVALIHHRTPQVAARALAALARSAPEVPVRVLDTGGTAPEALRVGAAHPHARLEPRPNLGYAATVNHALDTAGGALVCVMNADVLIEPDTLHALAAPFHDPRVALTGPLARGPDGRIQDQGIPYRAYTAQLGGAGPAATLRVPWVSGCIFAVRVAAAQDAGGMDASLRFYDEDLEWGLRLRARDWRVQLVGAEVVHLGAGKGPSDPRFMIEGLRGGMITARRHHGPVRRAAQRWAVGAVAMVRARVGPAPQRAAWHAVLGMFWHGRFDQSPFGETLDQDDPDFDPWGRRA